MILSECVLVSVSHLITFEERKGFSSDVVLGSYHWRLHHYQIYKFPAFKCNKVMAV